MRLNPSLPLSDSFQARLAAQAILRNLFDMKEAVAELRPDIKQWRSFGQRLLAEPAVQHKIEIILRRGDRNALRNALKFLKQMWDWLTFEGHEIEIADKNGGVRKVKVMTKGEHKQKMTAARVLAKVYLAR
jgi:hypothetical protein